MSETIPETVPEAIPETIQARVLRVIATTKRIPLANVTPDSTFEELGVDSLDRLNILFDLESEFDVEINDEDAKKVSSIHQMVDGITQLLYAKEHPEMQRAASPVPEAAIKRLEPEDAAGDEPEGEKA